MKHYLKSIILFLFIGVSSCSGMGSSYDYGEIIYINLDFEDSTHQPWESQYTTGQWNSNNHFEISNDTPTNGGSNSGRFYIGSGGDFWTSPNNGSETARSEIQLKATALEGYEVYYSWDIKIDSSYTESSDWQIIGQFHDQPDPALGESWSNYPANSPPLAFKYRNGELVIAVYSFDTNSVMDLTTVAFSKGDWHNLTFRVNWSVDSDGFMEFWLDGNIIQESGQSRYTARNCINNAGNYLKIGLYRSKNITTEGIVFYDNIKSGSTLSDVQ